MKDFKSKIVKIELARLTLTFSANNVYCILPIGTTGRVKNRNGKVPAIKSQLSLFVGFNWVYDDKVFKSNPNAMRSRGHFCFLFYLFWRKLNFVDWCSTNKTEVPFIDLNDLWFLKLISLVIFCDLKEQVFETTLQEAFMIRQYVIHVSFFKFIKTIGHRSYIWTDNLLDRKIRLDTGIELKTCFTIPNVTLNAIIWLLPFSYFIFVHSREAFELILRTFALPSKVYWSAFKKWMTMDIASSLVGFGLCWILCDLNPLFSVFIIL